MASLTPTTIRLSAGLVLFLTTMATAQRESPLRPYTGPSTRGVDVTTLSGKVMTGYQGWFTCEGDGAGLGWVHWAKDRTRPMGPGNVSVDLLPDVSEYGPDELFATQFQRADGSAVQVFSSHKRATVLRHFEWMRDYGLDGAFVQRFANGLGNPALRHHKDVVLAHAREGANLTGRAYALMYDLSGVPKGGVMQVATDWMLLRDTMRIGDDPAYLRHQGKPLVGIWGVGFNDGRPYTMEECGALVDVLKRSGCAVLLGVPSGWRTLNRDAMGDPSLHDVCQRADVISPWTPGRYRTPDEATRHAETHGRPDLAWCQSRSIDYLPVVFPGFSWHHLKPHAPIDQIPRLDGRFLWSQFVGAKAIGARMVYVAMFDEVDEGTAIFKCTNDLSGHASGFLSYGDMPSDHYLWLTGEAAQGMRREGPLPAEMPTRVRMPTGGSPSAR